MMTFAAFRMMQLQRENEYLQQRIGNLNDIDGSTFDYPGEWGYQSYNYRRASGSSDSTKKLIEACGNFFGRSLRFFLVDIVIGWKLIYQIIQGNTNKLLRKAKFTKRQRSVLAILLIFNIIIFAAITLLLALPLSKLP